MPKLNVDEKKFEDIEITLGGKDYVISEVTQDLFDRIKEAGDENKEDKDLIYIQLSIAIGEDVEVLKKNAPDLRRVAAAVRFITDSIQEQVEGKEGNG